MSLRTRCATALQCFHGFALYNLAAHQLNRNLRKQPKSYYNYLLNCDSVRVSVSPWNSALLQAERITVKVVILYTRISV